MTLILRHQVRAGIVAVAAPNRRPRTEMLHIAVIDVVLWIISNIEPQIVIIAASELLISCGAVYERYWLGLPGLYVEAVMEMVTTGWGLV